MHEVTLKFNNAETLEALMEFAKKFDVVIEKKVPIKKNKEAKLKNIPISFANKPDITALAGIWKDRDINQDELRRKAWGDRL